MDDTLLPELIYCGEHGPT